MLPEIVMSCLTSELKALLFSSAVYLSIDAREFHFIDIQFKSVHQIGSCTLDRMENRKREKERESMRHLYNVQT